MTAAHVDCSIDNLKGSAATTGHTTLRGLAHPLLAGTCSSVLRRAILGVTAGHCRRLTHVLVALVLGVVLLLAGTCGSVLRRAVLGVTAEHCRRLPCPLLLLIGGSALLPTRQAALLLVVLLLIGSIRGVRG